MRSASRLTDTAFNTIKKLLIEAGKACKNYQDQVFKNLNCTKIQCDEIWSFCGCKEKNVTAARKEEGWGDVWTWTAICADTKIIPSWHVGLRDATDAYWFMQDLASRLANRVQLTTDGHKAYLQAVEDAFGANIDYAILLKLFGGKGSGPREVTEVKYSQPSNPRILKLVQKGNPVHTNISTSYMERANLTIRMQNRRFTRLTNAFSKKRENLEHSVSLFMMAYNFCRIHRTLRCTPAMEAGVTDHVWTMEEVVDLIESSK